MSDHEAEIKHALEILNPPIENVRVQWEGVVADALGIGTRPGRRRANSPWSKRRFLLVATIVVIGLAIPVIAVGASHGWWFQQSQPGRPWWSDFPRPASGAPAIVASGKGHGENWTIVAYISKFPPFRLRRRILGGDTLCLTQIDGSLSNVPSASLCGALRGMKGLPTGKHGGWGTWFLQGYGPLRATIVGAVAPGVARVEIALNPEGDGRARTITARLTTARGIGGGIHFFVVHYPPQIGFNAVILLNQRGKIIKRQPR